MQRFNRWYRAAGVPRVFVLVLVVGLGVNGACGELWAADRGLGVVGPKDEAKEHGSLAPPAKPVSVPIKGVYRAVIIGINTYDHADDLNGAVTDVEAVRTVLAERYGFDPPTSNSC